MRSTVSRLSEEENECFLNINSVLNGQKGREGGDAHLSLHYEDLFLQRQGHPSFSEQFITDLPWGSLHGWTWEDGLMQRL